MLSQEQGSAAGGVQTAVRHHVLADGKVVRSRYMSEPGRSTEHHEVVLPDPRMKKRAETLLKLLK